MKSQKRVLSCLLLAVALSAGLGGCKKEPSAAPPASPPVEEGRAARGTGVDPSAPSVKPSPSSESPSSERAAPSAKPAEGSVFVQLGRVKLPVPAAWHPSESGQDPMHQVHIAPGPGMTCDIGLIDDHGRPEEAEKYLSGADRTYGGTTSRNDDLKLGGVALQGIRIAKPKAMPRASLVEAYVGIVGEDLIALNMTHLGEAKTERASCEQAFTLFAKALQ